METEYCIGCGAERKDKWEPCDECGGTVFISEQPKEDEIDWEYQELIGFNP